MLSTSGLSTSGLSTSGLSTSGLSTSGLSTSGFWIGLEDVGVIDFRVVHFRVVHLRIRDVWVQLDGTVEAARDFGAADPAFSETSTVTVARGSVEVTYTVLDAVVKVGAVTSSTVSGAGDPAV